MAEKKSLKIYLLAYTGYYYDILCFGSFKILKLCFQPSFQVVHYTQ